MATIQFGGLSTGLDTNALISGLVQAERRTIDVLALQKVRFQAQQGIFTSLGTKLGTLKSAAQALSLSSDFTKRSAASTDGTVLTASADSTALTGTYDITVDTLAKAKSVQSTSFTSTTDAVGTGTLTLTIGTTATDITVDTSNNTLTGLKDAINSSGAEVSASIVNVGAATSDYRLIVQSKNTGTENAVTISGTLGGGADPFAGGGDVVQAATDAKFGVNGLTVTRSSNTVSDVISGVTFNLLKEGDQDGLIESTDATVTLTVATDNASIQAAVQSFVDAYNDVAKLVNDQFKLDPNTKRQGTLAGDSVLRGALSRIRSAISSVGGIGTGFKYISDIGVSFEDDGTLSLDSAKLSTALSEDLTGVSNLFVISQNGLGKRVPDIVDDFISLVDGALTFRQNGITASISEIDKKIAREELRIEALEKRLVDQFARLESLVSGLNSQSAFLSQRLASLNSISASKK